MPSSGFSEDSRFAGAEEQRAWQMALEMLGAQESAISPHLQLNEWDAIHYDEMRLHASKRSQNMTECVPVPSSEHVAEIVGRQGCKIKALRAKTNTYIKTPVRGEEPVFVVTGRREDVQTAKREILSAAEHFSQIRASRKLSAGSQTAPSGSTGLVPPPPVPGQTTIEVRVPYRVVGLVVGPKGATIKRIQQQTNTYIVTPSREKEPIFEVTGLPDGVEQAKREIESHIAVRTGLINVPDPSPWEKSPSSSAIGSSLFSHAPSTSGPVAGPIGLGLSSKLANELLANVLYDSDEGIGSDSPLLGPSFIQPNIWSADFGLTAGQQTSSLVSQRHVAARRINSDPLCSAFASFSLGDSDSGNQDSGSTSPVASPVASSAASSSCSSTRGSLKRECILCSDAEIVAALVPCGHNLFCMTCAQKIVAPDDKDDAPFTGECPVCHLKASQAIRIFS